MYVILDSHEEWLCEWAEKTRKLALGTEFSFRSGKITGVLLIIQLQKMEHR